MTNTPLDLLPPLLGTAWLLPLLSFAVIVFFGPRLGKHGVLGGYVAAAAILGSFVLSAVSLAIWIGNTDKPEHHAAAPARPGQHALAEHQAGGVPGVRLVAQESGEHAAGEHAAQHHAAGHAHHEKVALSGMWYTVSPPGLPEMGIGYYIDALTVLMFVMVTLIATCIHFYAMGYMHDELHDVTDHEVTLSNGRHLHRRGRYYRFFQYLSLFCFSMLGLVIAGNVLMVFVFWELVGICSYFLIGFYIERKSASTAANKAFIVNRVGDFGFIIGLMALWGSLGTFNFGDTVDPQSGEVTAEGIFTQVRHPDRAGQLAVPPAMVAAGNPEGVRQVLADHTDEGVLREEDARSEVASLTAHDGHWRDKQGTPHGYWLLVVAGLGVFCGCVGKSAQFPLHTWLPDAMEGPTPVSALVHSATMVAAGVYLVGRFFPAFTPEVLLVIAFIGGITLFMAATIAITATDIKRVLAYSTVSQLGYMMLALGIGGWLAGLFHLVTHAFFKSLLFLCSGSVIHAVHTNEMPLMGGLRHKMPITAYTMLVGCLAIAGAPLLSGFYSKDYIIAHSMLFADTNPRYAFFFYVAASGAAITSFYMFRLWYMTFAGQPRDKHRYDHAHESPRVMTVPLLILAFLAITAAWNVPGFLPGIGGWGVEPLLEQAHPISVHQGAGSGVLVNVTHPAEHESHARFGITATLVASGTALGGFLLATLMYGLGVISADDARRQFAPVYTFLRNKWYFDELYNAVFVQPVLFISRCVSAFDRKVIDRFIDGCALWTRKLSRWNDAFDRGLVDGLVNLVGGWTYDLASRIRGVQTGNLRQYVLFIVVGTVVLFVLVSFYTSSFASR